MFPLWTAGLYMYMCQSGRNIAAESSAVSVKKFDFNAFGDKPAPVAEDAYIVSNWSW